MRLSNFWVTDRCVKNATRTYSTNRKEFASICALSFSTTAQADIFYSTNSFVLTFFVICKEPAGSKTTKAWLLCVLKMYCLSAYETHYLLKRCRKSFLPTWAHNLGTQSLNTLKVHTVGTALPVCCISCEIRTFMQSYHARCDEPAKHFSYYNSPASINHMKNYCNTGVPAGYYTKREVHRLARLTFLKHRVCSDVQLEF